MGLVPLIVVLGISFVFHDSLKTSALIISLLGGILPTYLLNRKYFSNPGKALSDGTIGNTAAVVGFGGAIAVSVIAGLTGSAFGGQVVALLLLAPHYIDRGVNTEALHRTIAISSGALD